MWTKGIPQEPGYYWIRGRPKGLLSMAWVSGDGHWYLIGNPNPYFREDIARSFTKAEFCPAVPPE